MQSRPAAAHAGASINIFSANPSWYVNPANVAELDESIKTASGKALEALKAARTLPSAYWIDTMSKVHGNGTDSLEGILTDAASKPTPELVVFMLYDLPNRDCDAKASNGEICCYEKDSGDGCDYTQSGDCADGLR